jgi:hypothetical protein
LGEKIAIQDLTTELIDFFKGNGAVNDHFPDLRTKSLAKAAAEKIVGLLAELS